MQTHTDTHKGCPEGHDSHPHKHVSIYTRTHTQTNFKLVELERVDSSTSGDGSTASERRRSPSPAGMILVGAWVRFKLSLAPFTLLVATTVHDNRFHRACMQPIDVQLCSIMDVIGTYKSILLLMIASSILGTRFASALHSRHGSGCMHPL